MTRKEEIQHKAGSIADGMKQHYAPQSECKGYYEGFIDGGKYADSTMIEKSLCGFSNTDSNMLMENLQLSSIQKSMICGKHIVKQWRNSYEEDKRR